MSFATILISALASSTFVHAIAVPPVKNDVPSIPHTPAILLHDSFQVGDLLSFDNDSLLRRSNTSSTPSFAATYFPSDFMTDNQIQRISKRATTLVFPPKADLTQPTSTLQKQNITKCGSTYIYISQPTSQGASLRAIDADGQLYTLKLLKDSRARDEEYKIQRRVTSHDTIINIYEKCEFGGSHAILLEYVAGETVAKKASAGLYKNEAAAKKAFAGILDAVEHVHSKDAAHLDIWGANIVVGEKDGVKLGGFGKATLNGEMDKIDVEGGIRSPEAESKQMANTQKVDVWELGTLFVTMLTGGTQPWTDANSADAKKIWEDREKSQRVRACLSRFQKQKFSEDFCGVLADIFAREAERVTVGGVKATLLDENLKIFDDCDDGKGAKKTGAKREVGNGEMVVTDVEDGGDEWVVRAML